MNHAALPLTWILWSLLESCFPVLTNKATPFVVENYDHLIFSVQVVALTVMPPGLH